MQYVPFMVIQNIVVATGVRQNVTPPRHPLSKVFSSEETETRPAKNVLVDEVQETSLFRGPYHAMLISIAMNTRSLYFTNNS